MLEKLKTKKIYLTLMIIVTLTLLSVGSYALMLWASKENTELTFRIGEVAEVIFSKGNDINVSNLGPVLDYKKDGEFTPFSIINLSEDHLTMMATFNIESISDNLKEESFKYVFLASEDNVDFNVISQGNFQNISNNDTIKLTSAHALKQKNYFKIIIYIDGNMNNPVTMKNGSLSGYINVEVEKSSLLTLSNLNLTNSIQTDTPNFSKPSYSTCDTSTDNNCESTVGIYSIQDDLGTSYYFRGDVTNNYVKFGKWSEDTPDIYIGFYTTDISTSFSRYETLTECQNSSNYNKNCTLFSRAGKDMYWRIIRINGDGTVRMIYDGINGHENGEKKVIDTLVDRYNFNSNDDDNTYVGYMYGTPGATTYAETHSNKYDSNIKTYLEDEWYKENLKDSQYEQYIADAIYCNDRSIFRGTGIGQTDTDYSVYKRLYSDTTKQPKLTCQNSNDRFTLESTNFSIETNGKLEEPIGLITTDEAVLAGSGGYLPKNEEFYLYNGFDSLTMTPFRFYYEEINLYYAAEMYILESNGSLRDYHVSQIPYVRPVINLTLDALKYNSETSNGSMEYPFTVTGQQ